VAALTAIADPTIVVSRPTVPGGPTIVTISPYPRPDGPPVVAVQPVVAQPPVVAHPPSVAEPAGAPSSTAGSETRTPKRRKKHARK
jgi:hypothetical protein